MAAGTYFAIAELILRALDAAPEFINATERFWRTVAGNPGAPGHVEQAMQAAFDHVRAQRAADRPEPANG